MTPTHSKYCIHTLTHTWTSPTHHIITHANTYSHTHITLVCGGGGGGGVCAFCECVVSAQVWCECLVSMWVLCVCVCTTVCVWIECGAVRVGGVCVRVGGGGSARACKVWVSVCTWISHSDTRARTSPRTCNDTHSPSHTYTHTSVHTTIMITSCPHQDHTHAHTHIVSTPRVNVHREQTHIVIPPRSRTHQNHPTSTLKHAHEHTRLRYIHRRKQKAEHRTQTSPRQRPAVEETNNSRRRNRHNGSQTAQTA